MADSLEQMYNEKPGFFSKLTDPFTLQDLAVKQAVDEYGYGEDVGGKGDALRHLLASAILAKRQGPGYADFVTTAHESKIPGIGSPAQAPEDREMDLHNNYLGRQLATQATSYPDLVRKAKQHIDSGSAKTVYTRAKAPTQSYDVIDAAIEKPIDLIRNMFTPK
jgi:hypothetical protein